MDDKVCVRDSRLKRKLVLLEKRLKEATNTSISHASKCPRDVQSATSFPYSSSNGMTPQKQAPLNIRLILSRKRNSSRFTNANGENIRGACARAWDFGPLTDSCKYCNATMWKEERSTNGKKTKEPVFSLCCSEGNVRLPLLKKAPPTLDHLLDFSGGTLATYYQNNMRAFNAMFAFTSMGCNIDYSTTDRQGPYNFRLNGHNYHRIGSLLPPEGQNPHFAQLYIHDTQNEVGNRVGTLHHVESSSNSDIVDILVKMLDENNVLVRSFRTARDRFIEANVRPLELCLLGNCTTDGRQYNIPSASEVAAVIVGDIRLETSERDIIVEEKSLGLKRISPVHPSYMEMQYPLLFPYGEDGFRPGIKHTNVTGAIKEKYTFVSIREYYAFRIQQRFNEGDTLLHRQRLFQQFVVDAYTSIEEARLLWVKNNQKKLRSELYQGLKDAVFRGDTDLCSVGQRILPATFTGSPRYMAENYQDAMDICRWAGYPDLFLMFTCNPKWNEITSFLSLFPGQKLEDHPDIVARVFKIKLDQLLDDLIKGRLFGRVIAVIYTIEYQKRGLPHAHILLFLHPDDKNPATSWIDEIITAEIPDYKVDPEAYEAMKQFMIHGPCGEARPSSPCMLDNKCQKHFPKKFCNQTTIDSEGFTIYCRQDDGRFVEKNGIKLDNRYVVPYNKFLLMKYQAHINVEWCNRSRSIKYLFKYVTKGPDRATFVLQSDSDNHGTGTTTIIDEIKMYLDCRYISSAEACWRILGFDIHHCDPAVNILPFHLEGQQLVTFEDDEHIDNVLSRPGIQETMFTEWMKTNALHECANVTPPNFPVDQSGEFG